MSSEKPSRWAFLQTLLQKNKIPGIPQALIQAVERCAQAPRLLEAEERAFEELYAELKAEGRADELEAAEYKMDLCRWQLAQAYEEALKRKDYISSLDSPERRSREKELCSDGKEGLIHWVKHWAWTHDPRSGCPLTTVPFKPFDYQEKHLNWIWDLVYKYRAKGLNDKSRDMGITWDDVYFDVHQWNFALRYDALVGSKTEDFVDKKGREDTLMEKMRFTIRMMPEWMLPKGFDPDKHMPYLNIINPETGSFIAGESANENFGRQGRYTKVFIDEFPIFPEGGFAAHTAVSESADTVLYVGTPKGKLNKFADLRFNSKIRVMSFHWKQHPWKDDRWYRMKSATMNDAEKAQELDIDYEASQVGLVLPQWSPLHSVITWSEFCAYFGERSLDEDGRPRIPLDWTLACMQDVGFTQDHRWVVTWAATPAARYPLSDSAFFYRQYMSPVGLAPDLVAEKIKELEAPYKEGKRMYMRKMSHEQTSTQLTFELKDLDFEKWQTDYLAGIAQLQNYMLVRGTDPNPFRPHICKGRSRLYVIVDDKQGMPKFDSPSQKWTLPDPVDDAGFARARFEIQLYHIPESEKGKPVRAQRPMKAFDDAMDTWRAHGAEFFPPIAPLSDDEMLEKALPANLRREAIARMSPEDMSRHWLTREMAAEDIDIPQDEHWRKKLYGGNSAKRKISRLLR